MNDKGTASALCGNCLNAPSICGLFGKKLTQATETTYQCRACSGFLQRKEQEQLFQKLKGPEPEKILQMVASKFFHVQHEFRIGKSETW